MKKKLNIILKVLLIVVSLSLLLTYTLKVKADSGFDSSWDSGGSDSWDSGSWDSDYGSGSGGSGSPLVAAIFLTVFYYVFFKIISENIKISKGEKYANNLFKILFYGRIILLIPLYIITESIVIVDMIGVFILAFTIGFRGNKNVITNKNYNRVTNYNKLTSDDILNQIPSLNIEDFYQESFNIYKEIQLAWMDNDIERVRSIISDEMFNTYKMQLETLKAKNQKNMMEDITLVDVYITNIRKQDNKEIIDVIMKVKCKDYLIDINTNKVIRGQKNKVWNYEYKLSYIRSVGFNEVNYCPNCGAPINDGQSSKCDYCGSIITKETDKFVLIDKKMLNQR